ncbi:MAG: WYL domain-containing protein [Alphaproteobacteria bacterium]|nr:WYL domain-containing protein [Alphaproteobacteria bacterium]
MAYEKTYDLLDLAIWMQSNRDGISLNDIMDRYGVSRRTAERMRDMIVNHFVQTEVVFGDNNTKRWYIPQGTLKDLIQFSAEELSVLELAYELFDKEKLEDKKDIYRGIIEKVKASIRSDVMRKIEPDAEVLMEAEGFICRPGPKLMIDKEILAKIRDAILRLKRIKIKYFNKFSGKISSNVLDAFGFLYGERNHYLVAHHSDGYYGDEIHNFILSNILEVEILNENYEMPENFSLQEYAELSFGAFHEEPFDVEWVFDSKVREEARKFIFHPKQTMIENEDGSLTVKFRAGGRMEMDWHLYTWGEHVKVIKPENLRR